MKHQTLQIGEIVQSTQGRDRGRFLVVMELIDEEHVLLVDGLLRRLDKPKKKKTRHMVSLGVFSEEIRQRINSGKKMNNALIRVELERLTNKEPEKSGG